MDCAIRDLPKAIIFELFDNPNADTTDVVRNAHFAQCRYVSGLVDEAFAVESCLFLHFSFSFYEVQHHFCEWRRRSSERRRRLKI